MNKFNKSVTALIMGLTLTGLCSSYSFAVEIQNKVNEQSTPIISVDNQSKTELMSKLKGIQQFSALFEQEVIDSQGNILQQGGGDIAVKRPNLVRWNTVEPDESLIVSDGQSIYLYDPFIEQVTAYKLEGAIANTPILLITSNAESLWDNYSVKRITTNEYLITANDKESRIRSLTLAFNAESELSGFTFLDITGQLSKVSLRETNFSPDLLPSLFKFIMQEGVHLDDQR